jgi:hypothetical protein
MRNGNISKEARLMTDQSPVYKKLGAGFASAPNNWPKASSASASHIDGLTAPTFKLQAKRFMRWRAKRQKRPCV